MYEEPTAGLNLLRIEHGIKPVLDFEGISVELQRNTCYYFAGTVAEA